MDSLWTSEEEISVMFRLFQSFRILKAFGVREPPLAWLSFTDRKARLPNELPNELPEEGGLRPPPTPVPPQQMVFNQEINEDMTAVPGPH